MFVLDLDQISVIYIYYIFYFITHTTRGTQCSGLNLSTIIKKNLSSI